jgi:hypothetical protein
VTETITYRISGTAMATIEGSELYQRPHLYTSEADPSYAASLRAGKALQQAESRRFGRGRSYLVTSDRAAADVIADYFETVGASFAGQMDLDTRAEGRALLSAAARIREALKRV